MVLFLDDAAVSQLVSIDDALQSVRTALVAQATGRAQVAPRQRARVAGAALKIMGGALETAGPVPSSGWMGAKVSIRAGDRKKAWVLLFDTEGHLRCLLVADRLGQLRTGAATGVSTDLLAHRDARVLACLGAGYQVWTQIEAVRRVRNIERVLLWNRTTERARSLARRLLAEFGVAVEICDVPSTAVAAADVVVTVTAASTPILRGADVGAGAHVVLVGSNDPQHREADAALFSRAGRVYVDDLAQARCECGDLLMAVAEGALDWSDVELLGNAVLRADREGAMPGDRARSDEAGASTIFCSHGIGSWDVALAGAVYEKAFERGLGVELPVDGRADE